MQVPHGGCLTVAAVAYPYASYRWHLERSLKILRVVEPAGLGKGQKTEWAATAGLGWVEDRVIHIQASAHGRISGLGPEGHPEGHYTPSEKPKFFLGV